MNVLVTVFEGMRIDAVEMTTALLVTKMTIGRSGSHEIADSLARLCFDICPGRSVCILIARLRLLVDGEKPGWRAGAQDVET